MTNYMIVKVKYTDSGMVLSTDRFDYYTSSGEHRRDRVILRRDYSYNDKMAQAVAWLKDNGHNVVGTDSWGRDMGFVVVDAIDHNFKSISGKHEKWLDSLKEEL